MRSLVTVFVLLFTVNALAFDYEYVRDLYTKGKAPSQNVVLNPNGYECHEYTVGFASAKWTRGPFFLKGSTSVSYKNLGYGFGLYNMKSDSLKSDEVGIRQSADGFLVYEWSVEKNYSGNDKPAISFPGKDAWEYGVCRPLGARQEAGSLTMYRQAFANSEVFTDVNQLKNYFGKSWNCKSVSVVEPVESSFDERLVTPRPSALNFHACKETGTGICSTTSLIKHKLLPWTVASSYDSDTYLVLGVGWYFGDFSKFGIRVLSDRQLILEEFGNGMIPTGLPSLSMPKHPKLYTAAYHICEMN